MKAAANKYGSNWKNNLGSKNESKHQIIILQSWGHMCLPQRHTQVVVPFQDIPPPGLEPGSLG